MNKWLLLVIFLAGAGCAPTHSVNSNAARLDSAKLQGILNKPALIDYPAVDRFVLQKYCTECHNSVRRENGVDLSSYDSIANGSGDRQFIVPYDSLSSALYRVLSANGKEHMPPLDHAQLGADRIQLIFAWIDNGAKLSPSSTVAHPPSLKEQLQPFFDHPETIDYGVVKSYLLGAACMKCHSLQGDSPDKDAIANSANMTSYKSLFSVFTPIISIGKPEESKLFQSAAITQSMPPTKDGYDPVDSLRVKLLRLWILNCAVEDKSKLGIENLTPDPKQS